MRRAPAALLLAFAAAAGGCTLLSKDKAQQRAGATDKPNPGSGSGAGSGSAVAGATTAKNPAGPTTTVPPAPPVGPLMPPQDEAKLDTAGNVVDYAKLCKAELGIPEAVQAPWNCLDGQEIPITVAGKPMDQATYAQVAQQGGGCDHPSWLGDVPCSNYAFVQRRELAPDVTAMLLCRERSFSTYKGKDARKADYAVDPSVTNFRLIYDFDSLGLIWTNRKTGKTCFFDFVGKVYGGYVASPDDEKVPEITAMPDPKPPASLPPGMTPEQVWKKNARSTWKPPGEVAQKDNCVRCHDTGPFKSSPYLAQVLEISPNDKTVPYQIVGRVMDPWRQQFPLTAVTTGKVAGAAGDEEQLCTTCHRIGSQASCDQQVAYATGQTSPATLSAHGSSFFQRMWMPPLPPDVAAAWQGKTERQLAALWNARYAAHVDRLRCCCLNANAKGCFRQDITQSPLPDPVEGEGPQECR